MTRKEEVDHLVDLAEAAQERFDNTPRWRIISRWRLSGEWMGLVGRAQDIELGEARRRRRGVPPR